MNSKEPQTTVTQKPTADMPLGLYKVIDADGFYRGEYRVFMNWCNERGVMEWYY